MSRTRTYAGCTLNNPTEDEVSYLLTEMDRSAYKWLVIAREVGETGTPHLQAAWSLKNGKTFKAMKTFLGSNRWHLEACKASQGRAAAYCLKGTQSHAEWEESDVKGPNYGSDLDIVLEIGRPPKSTSVRKGNAWADIVAMIEDGCTDREIIAEFPSQGVVHASAIAKYRLAYDKESMGWRDLEVTYLSGATGTGKTRSVMERYGYGNVYRVTDYHSGAFDMYDGEEVIVFEEFRSSFKVSQMLNYLDGYPVMLPARYSDRLAKFTKVYIITNQHIYEQFVTVQESHPRTWDAFLRRIHHFVDFAEDGSKTAVVHPLGLNREEPSWLTNPVA